MKQQSSLMLDRGNMETENLEESSWNPESVDQRDSAHMLACTHTGATREKQETHLTTFPKLHTDPFTQGSTKGERKPFIKH